MNIQQRIIQLRKSLELNQKEFATGLEIAPTLVSDFERGIREPSRQVLIKMALNYQVNINWLLTNKGSMYIAGDSIEDITLKSALPLLTEIADITENEKEKLLQFIYTLKKDR